MQCTACGRLLDEGAAFCRGCGRAVEPETPDARVQRLEARIAALESRLPNTNIISPKFWSRAFAVWGHELACVGVLYAGLLAVVLVFAVLAALVGAFASTR
jgi:hypothetical protein